LKDAAAASATFGKILEKYPNEPRAVYGLAIASILSGDADRAKELFEQLVDASGSTGRVRQIPADIRSHDLAWSHVYLAASMTLKTNVMRRSSNIAWLSQSMAPGERSRGRPRGLDSAYKPRASENGKESEKP